MDLSEETDDAAAATRIVRGDESRRDADVRSRPPRRHRYLARRFKAERERDARNITDLKQEREDALKYAIKAARPWSSDKSDRAGRTVSFAGTEKRDDRNMNNEQLAHAKAVYAKLDRAPRKAPSRESRALARRRPAPSARGDSTARQTALLEKRSLLMRLSSLVEEEQHFFGADSGRTTGRSFMSSARPSSARSVRSVASNASSLASAATVGSRAGAPPPRPTRVPRLRL